MSDTFRQAEGPHRPTVRQIQIMLGSIPGHVEVRRISINGQANEVLIETRHDDMEQEKRFTTSEYYDEKP